jgi:hypothetical protein
MATQMVGYCGSAMATAWTLGMRDNFCVVAAVADPPLPCCRSVCFFLPPSAVQLSFEGLEVKPDIPVSRANKKYVRMIMARGRVLCCAA